MITKTEALVLRVTPYSRTSNIVTWLSPAVGKIITVIKGANRPKSDFLGQYDLFQTCELLYYTRDRQGVHMVKECTPLEYRQNLHRDWRAAALASYECDLVARLSPEGGADRRIYDLLTTALGSLDRQGASAEAVFWFELRLLEAFGVAPQLNRCSLCGKPPEHFAGRWSFSVRQGGLLCQHCRPPVGETAPHLSAAALALTRRWQSSTTPGVAYSTRCTRRQALELRDLLRVFLAHHLDVLPESRDIAWTLFAYRTSP